jgi:hypothetical protein
MGLGFSRAIRSRYSCEAVVVEGGDALQRSIDFPWLRTIEENQRANDRVVPLLRQLKPVVKITHTAMRPAAAMVVPALKR